MTSPKNRVSRVLRSALLALLAVAGIWLSAGLGATSRTATDAVETVADGGQWGNKGSRGLHG